MKILIGVNTELNYINEEYIDVLVKVFGNNHRYWETFLMNKERDIELRKNETLHNYFKDCDFVLYEDEVQFIGEPVTTNVKRTVKIIDIPDDVKFSIKNFECAIGEQIVEDHRTWN